jgi:hypothetical protein
MRRAGLNSGTAASMYGACCGLSIASAFETSVIPNIRVL